MSKLESLMESVKIPEMYSGTVGLDVAFDFVDGIWVPKLLEINDHDSSIGNYVDIADGSVDYLDKIMVGIRSTRTGESKVESLLRKEEAARIRNRLSGTAQERDVAYYELRELIRKPRKQPIFKYGVKVDDGDIADILNDKKLQRKVTPIESAISEFTLDQVLNGDLSSLPEEIIIKDALGKLSYRILPIKVIDLRKIISELDIKTEASPLDADQIFRKRQWKDYLSESVFQEFKRFPLPPSIPKEYEGHPYKMRFLLDFTVDTTGKIHKSFMRAFYSVSKTKLPSNGDVLTVENATVGGDSVGTVYFSVPKEERDLVETLTLQIIENLTLLEK